MSAIKKENYKGFISSISSDSKKTIKVIKHSFPYHADDCFCTGLLLTQFNIELYEVSNEKEISEDEFNDPNIWIVDVGCKYETEKHNFDHHQYKPEEKKTAFGFLSSFFVSEKYLKERDIRCLIDRINFQDNHGVPGLEKTLMKDELFNDRKYDFKGFFESLLFIERTLIQCIETKFGEISETSLNLYKIFAMTLAKKFYLKDRADSCKEWVEKNPQNYIILAVKFDEEKNLNILYWKRRPEDFSILEFNASQESVKYKYKIDIIIGYNARDGLRSIVKMPKCPQSINLSFIDKDIARYLDVRGFLTTFKPSFFEEEDEEMIDKIIDQITKVCKKSGYGVPISYEILETVSK